MALSKTTEFYGVDDCKIFEITEDSSSAFTLGTEIDVPGIRQVSMTIERDTKKLPGDEKTLAIKSKVTSITIKAEHAQLSLDVLALTTGGTVSTSGSGGTEKHTLSVGADYSNKYFQFQAQIKGENGQDAHIIVYKAKATATPINGTQGDYAIFTFDCEGVFTEYEFSGESKLVDIELNATAAALAGVGSATAGVTTLTSNILKTESGGVIGVEVSGVKFISEAAAETTTNYTYSYGTTGLTVASATYINDHTVALAFTGTASAGTISITPKAAVMANGVQASAGTYVIPA